MKERLKKARKAADKTQKEVASILGITESAYCGYETGKRQPDALKISGLAKALGVSGDYLLGLTADPTPTDEIATLDETHLLSLFRGMTAKDRALILATAEALAKK